MDAAGVRRHLAEPARSSAAVTAQSADDPAGKTLVAPNALQALAEQCVRAADLVEGRFFEPTDDSTAAADYAWSEAHGWADARSWIGATAATYLPEAARLARAVAGLLAAATEPPTSVYLLARGVVERIGRMMWVLGGEGAQQRLVRAAFERTVCYQHYAKAAERLKATKEDREQVMADFASMQGWLEARTTVLRPPDLTPEEKQLAKTWHYPDPKDVATWIVNDDPYPSYGAVTKLAIERGTKQAGGALYAALSGFSHPNAIFANEYRTFDDDGQIVFGSSFHSYDVAARLAAIVLLFGATVISEYSSTQPADGLLQSAEEISQAFDGIAAEFG